MNENVVHPVGFEITIHCGLLKYFMMLREHGACKSLIKLLNLNKKKKHIQTDLHLNKKTQQNSNKCTATHKSEKSKSLWFYC